MRVLSWNIRAGGGGRTAAIVAAVAAHEADVLVISEYRDGDAGARLRAGLDQLGYRWRTTVVPPKGCNGVLIASRRRFRQVGPVSDAVAEPWRLVDVAIGNLLLTGVYMPNLRAKEPYWQALIGALGTRASRAALAIGDFNTCQAYLDEAGASDVTAHFLDAVAATGFCDLWRHRYPEEREFSWYSHRGNGFRIDHAFLSPRANTRAGAVWYSHAERLAGLSDHSALLVELG